MVVIECWFGAATVAARIDFTITFSIAANLKELIHLRCAIFICDLCHQEEILSSEWIEGLYNH